MSSDKEKQIEPICRFGPGGDFVSVWPTELRESHQPSSNRLAKLLGSIAEIIAPLLGSEIDSTISTATNIQTTAEKIAAEKENLEYGVKVSHADKPAYAAPAPIIKGNRRFSGEPVLFADDWRISIRAGHKPKHSIRAYRRTAKKRSSSDVPGQDSLFETNFKIARTA